MSYPNKPENNGYVYEDKNKESVGMYVVYVLTDKGWSEDERFDTEEDALGYKKEWLEEHPCINENQFKVEEE